MTVAADAADLARLEARADVPRPRLEVAVDWNLGQSGNYVAVNVFNGPGGRTATLREVGFTMEPACNLSQLPGGAYSAGEPVEALAYAALPIAEGEREITPGQLLPFRVPLAGLPWLWDEETDIYPYAYFDEGKWLVGKPSRLVGLLVSNGWVEEENAPPMFSTMLMDYVWPEGVSGLRGRFDLTAGLRDVTNGA
jgi:hypothetical protein